MMAWPTLVHNIIQILFVVKASSCFEGQVYDKYLQIIGDILSGPAQGRQVVLHLDNTLPACLQDDIFHVEGVRSTPHLTTHGIALTSAEDEVFKAFIHHPSLLHVMKSSLLPAHAVVSVAQVEASHSTDCQYGKLLR